MSFQIHPVLRAAPRFSLGAVISFCLAAATLGLLLGVAVEGIGLVEW